MSIDTLKRDKFVGILIHDKAPIFSNGIIQNAYFIYKCFEKIGMKCQFLCHEATPQQFELHNLSVQQISLNPVVFDPTIYHTIITVTRSINAELYTMLKKNKIAVIGFVCGNNYMMDQENFVRGSPMPGVSSFIGKGSKVDELWVIPSYEHSLEYLEIIRGKPAFIVPHLWSPEIIQHSMKNIFKADDSPLFYNILHHTNKSKIEIAILEPNIHFFKTAWLPLIVSEKLNSDEPDLIEQVLLFNNPEHECSKNMVNNLAVGTKVKLFKRKSIIEIMLHLNRKGTFPVIISHQVLNSLNYLYYELLYYGFPLVHNSPDLDGCGYYYPDNDIRECAKQVKYALYNHNKNIDTYREKAKKYLERVDPLHPSVGKIWNQMINDIVSTAQKS